MKKRLLIIISIIAVVLTLLSLIYKSITKDPNYLIRKGAVSISADKPVNVSYDYGHRIVFADHRIPVYEFIPQESAEYAFDLTDITTSSGDVLFMNVVDRAFSDYITVNNTSDDEKTADVMGGKAFLQKDRRYFILLDAVSAGGGNLHSGSFCLTVTKPEEETISAEITEDQTVRLDIKANEQESLLFKPEETGYYIFNTEISSGNASTGYSTVSGITGEDGKELTVADGLCRLEEGSEYFIQISVEELKGSAKVDVRCRRIETTELDESGSAEIESDSIIEYTAEDDRRLLVYSVSEGDPSVTVYDSKGFPVRSDYDSGAEFGGGSKDFAVVISVKRGEEYHIYVSGDFKECKVNAVDYDQAMAPDQEESGDEIREEESGNETARD